MANNVSLAPWSVDAVNLAEHANNPIHTDAGGKAAGFAGALVAGVTTYVYLTRPPAEAWGLDWVANGGGEVRFFAPVLDRDRVVCVPTVGDDGETVIKATVGDETRAQMTVVEDSGPVGEPRAGDALEPYSFELRGRYDNRGTVVGDDLELYDREGIVHPAVWPSLANVVMHEQLARGSWIHTRSRIRHHAVGPLGATAVLHSTLIERFDTRSGERAIVDMVFTIDDEVVVEIEHEALVALTR